MLTVVHRNTLFKIPHLANRVSGLPTPKLSDCVTSATTRKAHILLNDTAHPLHRYFIFLPSGRRYRLPTCNSFVPTAIPAVNTGNQPLVYTHFLWSFFKGVGGGGITDCGWIVINVCITCPCYICTFCENAFPIWGQMKLVFFLQLLVFFWPPNYLQACLTHTRELGHNKVTLITSKGSAFNFFPITP